jgi:arsenate reductase-like glutaredoxin family protein
MEVQVFGIKKSAETRKALRFFAERRIKTHFVDLNERAASAGELKRFAQKFGVEKLLDRESRRFAELGLRQAMYSPDYWLTRLVDEPLLLRMPLVRNGSKLTVGDAEAEWKGWLTAPVSSKGQG